MRCFLAAPLLFSATLLCAYAAEAQACSPTLMVRSRTSAEEVAWDPLVPVRPESCVRIGTDCNLGNLVSAPTSAHRIYDLVYGPDSAFCDPKEQSRIWWAISVPRAIDIIVVIGIFLGLLGVAWAATQYLSARKASGT